MPPVCSHILTPSATASDQITGHRVLAETFSRYTFPDFRRIEQHHILPHSPTHTPSQPSFPPNKPHVSVQSSNSRRLTSLRHTGMCSYNPSSASRFTSWVEELPPAFAPPLLCRLHRVPSLFPLLSTTSRHTRAWLSPPPSHSRAGSQRICARDGRCQPQHDSHCRHCGLRSR